MSRTILAIAFIFCLLLFPISHLRFLEPASDINVAKIQIPARIHLAGIDFRKCLSESRVPLPCAGGFYNIIIFANDYDRSLARTPLSIQPPRRSARLTPFNRVAEKLPAAPGCGLIPFLFFVLPFAQIRLNRREAFKYGVLLLIMFLSAFFPYVVQSAF